MKKRKILTLIIVCFASLALIVALLIILRSLLKKPDAGEFIRRERATIAIDGPFEGSSCSYKVSYKNADGEQTGTLSQDSFGGKLVRADTVDADIEVYAGQCCPIVSNPEPSDCRRTEEIRIIKVYK